MSEFHISPSGVLTNMSPDDDDYEMNYGMNGLVAEFRKANNLDIETGNSLSDNFNYETRKPPLE